MKKYFKYTVLILMLFLFTVPTCALGVGQTGRVNYTYLNVREKPTINGELLFKLNKDDIVHITLDSGDFWRVRCVHDKKLYKNVYVAKQYISDYSLYKYAYSISKIALYKGASTNSKKIIDITEGSKVEQIYKYKSFTFVTVIYKGVRYYGYVQSIWLTLNEYSVSEQIYYVNSTALNLRTTPSLKSDIVRKLYYGDEITVIDDGNNIWCKVIAKRGKNSYEGWVMKKYLKKGRTS